MLAEVAVIGTPAARMISTGIFAAGTRKATLPVFAVTLGGNREEALTMMGSGPGPYLLVIAEKTSDIGHAARCSACSPLSIRSGSGVWLVHGVPPSKKTTT